MRPQIFLILWIIFSFINVGKSQITIPTGENSMYASTHKATKEISYPSIEIIVPQSLPANGQIPLIVRMLDDENHIEKYFSGELEVSSSIPLNPHKIIINNGAGAALMDFSSDQDFTITISGYSKTILVNQNLPIMQHSGEISISEVWGKDSIHHITSDLIINEGATLSVFEACHVILDEDVNIWVYGILKIEGTTDEPVTFTSAQEETSWGGIRVLSSHSETSISHAIFTHGGGNEDYFFGHSSSQAVVFVSNSQIHISNSYFIQNEGKAFGGLHSIISINNCIANKCDTGGEFHSCFVEVEQSHFSEIPDGDGVIADDDNDGLYFYYFMPAMEDQPSIIKDCIFSLGEDDGIDHNEAKITISGCLINDFFHEGIAASAGNFANVFDCVVLNCEQGIEAGYGSPQLTVNHCTILDCEVGIRFGDNYTQGCSGYIEVQNSICFNNQDNFLNYDLLLQDSVANAISVSYSITNDEHYNQYPHCLEATPIFNADYYLSAESPGVAQAADGCDMGLYRCNTSNGSELEIASKFHIFPNPCKGKIYISPCENVKMPMHFKFIDLTGKELINQSYSENHETYTIDLSGFSNDQQMILLNIKNEAEINSWHKIIIDKEW